MMEISREEFVREIPSCGHLFHVFCIESWLKVKELCPLCKTGLSKYDLDPESYGPNPDQDYGIEIQNMRPLEVPPIFLDFLSENDNDNENNQNLNSPPSEDEEIQALDPYDRRRLSSSSGSSSTDSDMNSENSSEDPHDRNINRERRMRRNLNRSDIAGIERNIVRMSDRINDLTTQINELTTQVNNRQTLLDTMDENDPDNLRLMNQLSEEIENRTREIDNIISNEVNISEIDDIIN